METQLACLNALVFRVLVEGLDFTLNEHRKRVVEAEQGALLIGYAVTKAA